MLKPTKQATILFLIDTSDTTAMKVCLAMKKRGFGKGRWNGTGGKVEPGESIRNAVKREALEEIGITPSHMKKAAELTFLFENNPDWNQIVHVYIACLWKGIPTESEEMNPQWFDVKDIPYDQMWEDDIIWLPAVLENKFIKAEFTFGPNDKIITEKTKFKTREMN
jgi:8-oxo-dGTP pyrophosphatase MutT (NUDIX family)